MYGSGVANQITISLPHSSAFSWIALVLTVVSPFTKYALTIGPVAMALEGCLPMPRKWCPPEGHPFSSPPPAWWSATSLLLRSLLVLSTLVIGLTVPFFAYVMAFIGSFLSQSVSVVLPCVCYVLILWPELGTGQKVLYFGVALGGLVCAAMGTASAVDNILHSYTKSG